MSRLVRITQYALLLPLFACASPAPQPATQTILYALRNTPPTLLEFSADLKSIRRALPLSFPPDCGLYNLYPSPYGIFLALELSCSFGQTVLLLNSETATLTQAFPEADSHFLAWTADGSAIYISVDSAAHPRILRVDVKGNQEQIPITELTYDMAAAPDDKSVTFTFSRGLGYGSEIWSTEHDGNVVILLLADTNNYISFARFSPDGKQIAFIKIPDSQTPFTVGELWVIPSTPANGASAQGGRFLAKVDAGHGYAANWSPDGTKLAFVVRENTEDESADISAGALVSNIYIVDVVSGEITQLTQFENAQVETPTWSPNGNTIAFQAVVNDRMEVHIANMQTGETRSLIAGSACCLVWMRK
jgi:Tol biopolymer transport system component